MIHFVIGRTKTGKSTYCLNRFAEEVTGSCINRQPCFFVVPEQYALMTERKLLHLDSMQNKALLQDEVISFKRLSHRILSHLGGLMHDHLDETGKLMLLTQIAYKHRNDLCYYKELHTQAWQLNRVLSLFAEFEKYAVGINALQMVYEHENLQGTLQEKLHDLRILYQSYQDSFSQIGMTEGNLFHLALEKAKEFGYFNQSSVWIDSFTGFTKLEREFIRLLMQQCKDVTIALTLDDDPIFDCIRTTYLSLIRMAKEMQIPYETICLQENESSYYKNEDLLFLEQAYTKLHEDAYDKTPEHVHLIECSHVFEEISRLAQSIQCRNKAGIPYGKIAVATRNPEEYDVLIEAVFAQYQIPFFIDARRNVQSNPLVISILALLRIFHRNFRQEDVLMFLKAGLYLEEPDELDTLENMILARRIQGLKRFSQSEQPVLVRFADFISDCMEQFKAARSIEQLIDLFAACITTLQFPEKMEAKSQFFFENGFADRGDLYQKIWSQTQSFLSQIKLFLGTLPVSSYTEGCETIYRLLNVCFASYESGFLPQNPDAVQITSIERSRLSDVDTLYIIGTVEGAFPAPVEDNGLLSDQERSWLLENAIELADDTVTKISKERFLIYTTLFAPSGELYVSYPMQDFTGKACAPAAAVIGQIRRLCPNISVEKHSNKTSKDFSSVLDTYLDTDCAKKLLLPNEIPLISVSRLETYRDCPYKFFLSYGLRAEERKIAEMAFSDIGDLMHKLVETGTALIIKNNSSAESIIKQIFDDSLASGKVVPEAIDTGRGQILLTRLKKFAASTLNGIKQQIDAGAFVPVGFEVAFGMNDENSLPPLVVKIGDERVPAVRIHGKIDRFDACTEGDKTYIRVIDYKSSAQSIKQDDVYLGRRLQLITYMKALIQQDTSKKQLAALLGVGKEQSFIPAGILYFSMHDDFDKVNSKGEYVKKTYCMDGFVLNDTDVVERMIGDESAEVISYSRKKDGSFKVKGNWIAFDDYNKMSESVDFAIRYSVKEILGGKIAACPQKKHDGKIPCTSCAFGAVCGTVLKD